MYYISKKRSGSSHRDPLLVATGIALMVLVVGSLLIGPSKFGTFELKVPVGWKVESTELAKDFSGESCIIGVLTSEEESLRSNVVWNQDGSFRFFAGDKVEGSKSHLLEIPQDFEFVEFTDIFEDLDHVGKMLYDKGTAFGVFLPDGSLKGGRIAGVERSDEVVSWIE